MRRQRFWISLACAMALLVAATTTRAGDDLTTRLSSFLTQLYAGSVVLGGTSTKLTAPSDGVLTLTNNAATNFTRLQFGGTTSSFPSWKRNGAALEARLADDSARAGVFADTAGLTQATITAGSGTGVTVNAAGQLQRQVYKVTVDDTAFTCAALTCDVTVATLPAKTSLLSVYADLTQTFACTATCTSSTLSMTLGSAAGGAQYLASFDADAATALFGDADAELGTAMTRAAAIQGGAYTNAGNVVSLRLTSGTGAVGNGTATNLSQGSVTFYLVTERLP